jgi:hypothetical protein
MTPVQMVLTNLWAAASSRKRAIDKGLLLNTGETRRTSNKIFNREQKRKSNCEKYEG